MKPTVKILHKPKLLNSGYKVNSKNLTVKHLVETKDLL